MGYVLLHVVSFIGAIAGFIFVTLSLASGLLWLAELIEEHSTLAKVIGKRAIYAVIGLHIALLITDSMPFLPILFSVVAHFVYLSNFTSQWPFMSLTSPRFLASCCMVVADHFIWFFHFADVAQEAKRTRTRGRYGPGTRAGLNRGNNATTVVEAPSFLDVTAFFAICVWLVPLFLFLSLSANDNVLPSLTSTGSAPPTPSGNGVIDLSGPIPGPSGKRPRSLSDVPHDSLVKSILAPILSYIPRVGTRSSRGSYRRPDGLIAPRTPVKSPLPSPGLNGPGGYMPWSGPAGANSSDLSVNRSGYLSPMGPPSPGGAMPSSASGGLSIQNNSALHLRGPPSARRRYTTDVPSATSPNDSLTGPLKTSPSATSLIDSPRSAQSLSPLPPSQASAPPPVSNVVSGISSASSISSVGPSTSGSGVSMRRTASGMDFDGSGKAKND